MIAAGDTQGVADQLNKGIEESVIMSMWPRVDAVELILRMYAVNVESWFPDLCTFNFN